MDLSKLELWEIYKLQVELLKQLIQLQNNLQVVEAEISKRKEQTHANTER